MFTVALFTIAKIWKQHKCPLVDEWIRKTWYIHIEWNITCHEKEWNLAISDNMNGTRECHAKWNKSDTERQIMYYFTYMWNKKEQMKNITKYKYNYRYRKQVAATEEAVRGREERVREIQYQFSHSVVSNSLQPHEPQHTRPPCPSPTSGVYPDSCASSWCCHPAISSSVIPFSSCPPSLPASGSFPTSQHFAWGSQSTGLSALASFLPNNVQDWCA